MSNCSARMAAVGASLLLSAGALRATTVYDNLPSPIPQNSPSLGFQANHTSEFGDLIELSGGPTNLTSGSILMNDKALESDYPTVGDAGGWSWPITLNIYNVDSSSGTPQAGSLIYTDTETFNIPWEPVGQPGQDFLVTFNLPNVAVPGEFIYSVVYNTETFGPNPTNDPNGGPYISLNVAVNDTAPPAVGSRPNPDSGYLNANADQYYFDGGAGGPSGVFRQDTGYTPYSLAGQFSDASVPEPASFALLCCGGGAICGLIGIRRRRKIREVPTN